MTTLTKRAQGTFCWPELASPDPEQSKRFYATLFGWTTNDIPMPEEMGGGHYSIFQLGGRDVGAMYRLGPEMAKQGIPPNWGAYIAVDDADAIARKAKELGGTVLMEPMDVMGSLGRMAALRDPTGAAFNLWQAGTHIGAQRLDENGALCWTELMTRDVPAAKAFYTSLIGYGVEVMPMSQGGEYTMLKDPADGARRAGMMAITPQMGPMPPNWSTYFQTPDIRKTVGQTKSMGGKVFMDVTPIPHIGEFAVLQDPQGAPFALLQRAS